MKLNIGFLFLAQSAAVLSAALVPIPADTTTLENPAATPMPIGPIGPPYNMEPGAPEKRGLPGSGGQGPGASNPSPNEKRGHAKPPGTGGKGTGGTNPKQNGGG